MSSKILQLTVGSRDLFQAGKKLLLLQAEQIHRMTTIFIQNYPGLKKSGHFE